MLKLLLIRCVIKPHSMVTKTHEENKRVFYNII